MNYHLTVIEPFGDYVRGAHITDEAEVSAILAGDNAHHVLKRFPQDVHASGAFYKTDAELAPTPARTPVPAAKSPSSFDSKASQ